MIWTLKVGRSMKNILIHGLGQNKNSWKDVDYELKKKDIETNTPNLYSMFDNAEPDYITLFNKFSDYCNAFEGKLNLCGLSLGGILAIDYAKKFPDKVNSIILIGTPYKIPKFLFNLQSIVFHFMPKAAFEKMGCSKKIFISLVKSMGNLDIAENLDRIQCKSLILCGIKDNQNMDSAKSLNKKIKGSLFRTVSKSSHEVNIDNPKELSTFIYDFWNDVL